MTTPTIAVKESLDDLKGIGPSTGISGFKLVQVIGKGTYEWKTGDQSANVPGANDGDVWVAPSEDTSGKSGAWKRLDEILTAPGTSSDPSLAFDTWRTPNANRPTKVLIRATAVTDGTTNGQISLLVDEGGGTTADWSIVFSFSSSDLPAGTFVVGTITWDIPAGGSYQIQNTADPNAENNLGEHREVTL